MTCGNIQSERLKWHTASDSAARPARRSTGFITISSFHADDRAIRHMRRRRIVVTAVITLVVCRAIAGNLSAGWATLWTARPAPEGHVVLRDLDVISPRFDDPEREPGILRYMEPRRALRRYPQTPHRCPTRPIHRPGAASQFVTSDLHRGCCRRHGRRLLGRVVTGRASTMHATPTRCGRCRRTTRADGLPAVIACHSRCDRGSGDRRSSRSLRGLLH